MISLGNDLLFAKCQEKEEEETDEAIWHIRALEIILIFANCSIIMEVSEEEKPSPHRLPVCHECFLSPKITQLGDEVCNFSVLASIEMETIRPNP